jgi:hypothetical protein
MSKTDHRTKQYRSEPLPPLNSAADCDPANRPRLRIGGVPRGDKLKFAIKTHAKQRAPTSSSEWRHHIGFAGEVAASTYYGVSANWNVTDDYIGDNGWDFIYDDHRVEVKTTSNHKNLELEVPAKRIDDADYFILAHCPRPDDMVQLVGCVSRPDLKAFGRRFAGDMRLSLEYMESFNPIEMYPDQALDIQNI